MISRISKLDKIVVPVIIALSVIVPLLVLVLLSFPQNFNFIVVDAGTFPLFHASLNFTTALLLIIGYFFMKIREYKWHRNIMISAFFLSVIFLVSYLISKTAHPPVSYGGEGIL